MLSESFFDKSAVLCIAGKNDIAVRCLSHLLELGINTDRLCAVLNKDDVGRSTWQDSLGFHARRGGVAVRTLDEIKSIPNLWFFSVEFDRIIRPDQFLSTRLYNVHFSKLPAYRGVSTSVWPILRGEQQAGVTFHSIDSGIDTGPIIHQRVFDLDPNWTARDLYFRFLKEGFELFRESLAMLLDRSASERPQDESAASVFRRRDLDFRNLIIDPTQQVRRVQDQIRAYSFWEYQLPLVAGRKVWSSRILPGQASASPGGVRMIDRWQAILSALGGDIELRFSPYDELFAWAEGSAPMPELSAVPDLDLQDAQGWSAMMKAANAGNICALSALAKAGASPSRPNRRGTTPLMYAFTRMIEKQDPSAFQHLLKLGADPSAQDQHDRSISDYATEADMTRLRLVYPTIF